MDEKFLVSIVIPVYNTELYLEQCIESILIQTYDKYELILVDDGSTDSSLEICKKYAINDERIKVISQKNKGASSARNTGIRNAMGEYLIFVDSDDRVASNLLEILVNKCLTYNPDVIIFGWKCEGERNDLYQITEKDSILSGKDVIKEIIKDNYIYGGGYTVNKFWNVKKIKRSDNWFDEDLFAYEDKVFAIENYKDLSNILLIPEVLYFYNIHGNSLSRPQNINWHMYVNIIKAHEKIVIILSDDEVLKSIAVQKYYEEIIRIIGKAVKRRNGTLIKELYSLLKYHFIITLKNSAFSLKSKAKYIFVYCLANIYCFYSK